MQGSAMTAPLRLLRPFWAIPLLILFTPDIAHAAVGLPAGSRAACDAWTIVPSPGTGTPNAYLEGIGGSADNDIWAVGFAGTHRAGNVHTLTERYTRC
jgi:hypothetical protein